MSVGGKQTWFFLRGLVRESGHWAGFLERFEAAFPERRAVGIDLLGNGAHFREASPLSVGVMAEAARKEFLSFRSGNDHLFALSLGGMVGLEWMARWPRDFASAVLVNTSVRGLSPLHHRLRPANYARILSLLLSGDPARVESGILAMTSNDSSRHASLLEEWIRIHEARPVSSANAVRQLLAAARFRPSGNKPTVPLLVLNGAGDRLVNPACSRAIAQSWEVELRVHPTAGHDLTLDEPEWVIQQLSSWNSAT